MAHILLLYRGKNQNFCRNLSQETKIASRHRILRVANVRQFCRKLSQRRKQIEKCLKVYIGKIH